MANECTLTILCHIGHKLPDEPFWNFPLIWHYRCEIKKLDVTYLPKSDEQNCSCGCGRSGEHGHASTM